jgi:NDP-sugar pyrophosphorylase family protein
MKAIVLAAGKGERLKEVIRDIPKPMLKIKGEIILEHNIKWLKNYGIKDIFINLHYLPQIIKNYFKDGRALGVKIHYSCERKILGTAGAVRKIAKNWHESFLVVYGDNFYPFNYNLTEFINFYEKHRAIAIIGLYSNKREIWKSGVVLLDKDYAVRDFIEKPSFKGKIKLLNKGLINTGVYILNPKIIDYIPEGYSDFGKDIFTKLMQKMIPIYGYRFFAQLVVIDTPELYKKERLCNGRLHI